MRWPDKLHLSGMGVLGTVSGFKGVGFAELDNLSVSNSVFSHTLDCRNTAVFPSSCKLPQEVYHFVINSIAQVLLIKERWVVLHCMSFVERYTRSSLEFPN